MLLSQGEGSWKKSKGNTWKKSKAKILIPYYISRWSPVISWEAESQNAEQLLQKTKNKLCPHSLCSVFMAQQMPCGVECPFGQFGSAVLVCRFPHTGLEEVEEWGAWQNSSDAMRALFNRTSNTVFNTVLATNSQQSSVRAAVGEVTSVPDRKNKI